MTSNTTEKYCAVCCEPQQPTAWHALVHMQTEHLENEAFQAFLQEVVVGNHCSKCGKWYWSDVHALNEHVFAARPYCADCREENRALKDLLVDHMTARELLSRGLLRPDLAESARTGVV